MAQIHAQQASDRIRELEQWGAVFDRTLRVYQPKELWWAYIYLDCAYWRCNRIGAN